MADDQFEFSRLKTILVNSKIATSNPALYQVINQLINRILLFSGEVRTQLTNIVSGINQLTGDVTAGPGTGSQPATIANDAVTYAKMQNVSAASRLLGRGSAAGSGDPQEISLGSGIAMAGTTLNATGTGINQLTGDVTAGPGSGSQIATIPNDTVTYAKMQNVSAASRLLGRGSAAGSGDPQEITLGSNLTMSGTTISATPGSGVGGVLPFLTNGRLTLESGVPVSTTDQVGKSTIYFTPYLGNHISLYTASVWTDYTFTELSLALSGLTSGKNYDVFIYDNSGTLTLELSAAWASAVARTDALASQDGIKVKSGATNKRYIGTIFTTATTTTEDSVLNRYCWNQYNQQRRPLLVMEATNSWTYQGNWRQANASTANQVSYTTGDDSVLVEAQVICYFVSTNGNVANGVGIDSTTVNSAYARGNVFDGQSIAVYKGYPGLGKHDLKWLEISQAAPASVATFYGDAGGHGANDVDLQSAMDATIWG